MYSDVLEVILFFNYLYLSFSAEIERSLITHSFRNQMMQVCLYFYSLAVLTELSAYVLSVMLLKVSYLKVPSDLYQNNVNLRIFFEIRSVT